MKERERERQKAERERREGRKKRKKRKKNETNVSDAATVTKKNARVSNLRYLGMLRETTTMTTIRTM